MKEITMVGPDLAKNVFQAHAVDVAGTVVIRRQVRRAQMMLFFSRLAPCLIGMEACTGAHYWARELTKRGHELRLIPPSYVKPFVRRGKTDAADAEAIGTAVTQPTMRIVPVRTEAQQAVLMSHRTPDVLVRQLTRIANANRSIRRLPCLGAMRVISARKRSDPGEDWLWPAAGFVDTKIRS